MPSKSFAKIGINVDGEYRQLNSNILQIENEFYAPIRAKRVTKKGEKPSQALSRAGVEYIEVRALDVNPFSPVGIDATQVRFLDLFLLYCLLSPSENTDEVGEAEIAANLKAVVLEGRKPGLELQRNGKNIGLTQWMHELFAQLDTIAKLLDGDDSYAYKTALNTWSEAIDNPNKTLSGRVMNEVVLKGTDHGVWVKQLANDYHEFLSHYPLSDEITKSYEDEAKKSLLELQSLEAQPQDNFAVFLQNYFNDVVPAGTFEAK